MKDSSTKKALSRAEREQLAWIATLPDEQIDTADIPEAPIENWAQAHRGDFYRPVKRSVTIRLDADILDWLEAHAADGRYQTEINRILRRHVVETETKLAARIAAGAAS